LEGDEFAISVNDFKNTQDLVSIAIRLIQIANRPFTLNEQEIRLGCSIGIATLTEEAKSCYTVIEHAEFSMHQAKVAGGNQYKFYSNSVDTGAAKKLKFAAELRSAVENIAVVKSAVENNNFVLHYQPQVTIPELDIFGCEALIRWQHAKNGWIAPNDFIPLAEQIGLINPIGHWCIEEACGQIAQWEQTGVFPRQYSVSINVSALQLRNKDLLRHIKKSLDTHAISPERIHLEITETSIMDNPEVAVSVLREISNIGIKIAIDDFGTGYSSLKYLTKLPVDILKIDQSFVSDIGIDSGNETIIRGIIHLSEGLGFQVIAEGVETDYQLDFLVSEGCRLAQGFLFYRPMEKDQVLALMG
jgi:EAL domain-containing protein (putative c-di-GMP-specific phosphodiesterase class I)